MPTEGEMQEEKNRLQELEAHIRSMTVSL